MKLTNSLLAVAAICCVTPAVLAQDTSTAETRADAKDKTCYRRLDKILDQDVRLTASVAQGEEIPTASIDDVLVDLKNGEIRYFVLGCSDNQVLIHADELTWNVAEDCFDLKMSEKGVEALSAFNLKEAREDNLNEAISVAEASMRKAGRKAEKAAVEASAPKPMELFPGSSYVLSHPRFISGDSIDDLGVYTASDEFGGVTDCIVDCNTNKMEFLIVSVGGIAGVGATDHLVPMSAVTLCRKSEEMDSKQMLCSPLSKDQLEKSSKFQEDDKVCLTKDAAMRSRKYFENAKPANETK